MQICTSRIKRVEISKNLKKIITFLPSLVNLNAETDVIDKVHSFQKKIFIWKAIDWLFDVKEEQIELKKYEFEDRGIARQTVHFYSFSPTGFTTKKHQSFQMEFFNTSKKVQNEILKKETKPVVLKKHESENQNKSIL